MSGVISNLSLSCFGDNNFVIMYIYAIYLISRFICDFLDLFTLNIYSIFLVQEIFERYSGEIEYIFDFSSSREIRERFGKDPGEIEYIFDFSSSREI